MYALQQQVQQVESMLSNGSWHSLQLTARNHIKACIYTQVTMMLNLPPTQIIPEQTFEYYTNGLNKKIKLSEAYAIYTSQNQFIFNTNNVAATNINTHTAANSSNINTESTSPNDTITVEKKIISTNK